MSDGEEKSVEGDFSVTDVELILDHDIDAGEGVDGEGVDECCYEVNYDNDEAIRLFPVSCCPLHLNISSHNSNSAFLPLSTSLQALSLLGLSISSA